MYGLNEDEDAEGDDERIIPELFAEYEVGDDIVLFEEAFDIFFKGFKVLRIDPPFRFELTDIKWPDREVLSGWSLVGLPCFKAKEL